MISIGIKGLFFEHLKGNIGSFGDLLKFTGTEIIKMKQANYCCGIRRHLQQENIMARMLGTIKMVFRGKGTVIVEFIER